MNPKAKQMNHIDTLVVPHTVGKHASPIKWKSPFKHKEEIYWIRDFGSFMGIKQEDRKRVIYLGTSDFGPNDFKARVQLDNGDLERAPFSELYSINSGK